MEGFLYPNEVETAWSLLIVLYPFITGLVAGAFIVSSLYHAFGIQALRPLARFSLITALAFVLVAPLPLVAHLGRPERATEVFMTPNFRSAIAGFGYILLFYELLLIAETWLAFRSDIVERARTSTGVRRAIYGALTLGSRDISERARQLDARVIKVLAFVGIPSAFLLHGYVGFVFGSIKANPWWSTPLMPIIFLLSAMVSGVALLIVLYGVAMKLRRQPIDHACLAEVRKWLLAFVVVDLALEGLELLSMAYENEESWPVVSQLLTQKLALSFFGIQLLMGAILPMAVLAYLVFSQRLSRRVVTASTFVSALLLLAGVFAMRWNVVIGGQAFSKSLRGFKSYVPPLIGGEGVLMALAVFAVPFVLLVVLSLLLPPWEKEEVPSLERDRVVAIPLGVGVGHGERRASVALAPSGGPGPRAAPGAEEQKIAC